jgi:ubiquinone/menaquinone biosynthesis C-methylase UbiE
MTVRPFRIVLSRLLASSSLKGRIWPRWYRYLEKTLGEQPIWFLNDGYLPASGTPVELRPEDEVNRAWIQLYDVVTRPVDLEGATVLEVSCGRGGGARFVNTYRRPKFMIGLDRTEQAIAFCRRQHKGAGSHFICSDAQYLPFSSASFHAVINIEASHCYPDVPQFFREVHRVLRPGGHFLYADLRMSQTINRWRQELKNPGFRTHDVEVITPDVVRALEHSSDRVSELIHRLAPRWARRFFSNFAATKGTIVYKQLQSGAVHYVRYILQKV